MKMQMLVCIVCVAYKLNLIASMVCIFGAMIFNIAYQREEKIRVGYLKKFKDVVLYMEQIIYSFKKQPKIRPALLDAQKISSPEMKEIIEEAVVNIDSAMTENIYEESLELIQDEYDCKRLRSLHEFIVKIENNGGEYESYINAMLEDIKEWSDRTLLFVKNVERVKRNVLISILSTLITCGFMAYLIPKEYQYTTHIVYQICSAAMIVVMLVAYFFIIKKLNIDWINEAPSLPDNMVIKYYMLVERGYENQSNLKFFERLSYKKAKKRLEDEISKVFPDWIREVAINIQNDTVQSAIERTYETAPLVLKRPVRKLLIDFEKYPVGIEPYDNFLKEFDLPDIKSSMKMFYSINELGKGQSDRQIGSIIDRNNKLTRQSEEMKNKDRIGIAGMFSAVPMLLGVIKIMIDMILMIIVFTSSISNVISG